jgi:peptidoglycan/xylan/chitin deacetylase (PgdA/CDA1 family)
MPYLRAAAVAVVTALVLFAAASVSATTLAGVDVSRWDGRQSPTTLRALIALGRPIYSGGPRGDEVALTFDDGPEAVDRDGPTDPPPGARPR